MSCGRGKGWACAGVEGWAEAEFVRRARDTGLLIRPRYAKNTTDVMVGYAVKYPLSAFPRFSRLCTFQRKTSKVWS